MALAQESLADDDRTSRAPAQGTLMTEEEPKKSVRRPLWSAEIFAGVAVTGLVAGGAAWVFDAHDAADVVWASATVLGFVAATTWVVASLRAGRPGVDVLAVLALAGTLLVGEYIAGALVTVMLGTGRVLEQRAAGRAERELRALLARTPRWCIVTITVSSRHRRWSPSHPAICSSSAPAKWSRSTAASSTATRCLTSRPSPARRFPSPGRRATRCAAASSTRVARSTCARNDQRG